MKLILEANAIQPNPTGIGRYALELAKGLLNHPNIDKTYLNIKDQLIETLPTPGARSPLTKALRKTLRVFRNYPIIKQLRDAHQEWGFKKLNKQIRLLNADIYHAPNFIFRQTGLPTVVTIHDFSFMHYPEFHPKERIASFSRNFPNTIKNANHFITDSEFVRQELIALFGVNPDKISTIPLGVHAAFQPQQASDIRPTLEKYQLKHGKYLFSAATIEPRKNLANLIVAYSHLPLSLQQEYPLVLAGSEGWLSKTLHKTLNTLQRQGSLKYLGYIPDHDLRAIYAGAKGFAFPSLYEGFGLPVLEAMACGIPVLTSQASSMSEMTEDAAILVYPYALNEITQGLEKLLLDDTFCQQASAKGQTIAARYTWETCVQKTITTYQKVVS